MEESHPDGYPYTVTVRSPDSAVLCCLAGLSMYAQRVPDPDRRPEYKWHNDGITFYFTTPQGVQLLLAKARQLLPADAWFVEVAPRVDGA